MDKPCVWIDTIGIGKAISENALLFDEISSLSGVLKIHIYIPEADNTTDRKTKLLTALRLAVYSDRFVTNDLNADFTWITV